MRVLVSWIGHTDIRFLLNDCDEGTRNEISKYVRQKLEPPANGGPIKTILSHEKFDKIYLISNLSEKLNSEYVKCLGFDADVQYEEVKYDPPKDILKKMRALENSIITDMDELEALTMGN
ncbi:MAG: hypothetical protein WC340_13665 [Kiritimatiellia bacterium]|jgi:succinyl-CoA synthetase beta subunit